jgi:hypothetical protein
VFDIKDARRLPKFVREEGLCRVKMLGINFAMESWLANRPLSEGIFWSKRQSEIAA